MDGLILLGRQVAPFAIQCAVTISLAAIAGLLAARCLGPRQSARAFLVLAAALGLAALQVLGRGPARVDGDPPGPPAVQETRAAPVPPAEFQPGAAPARTATPGLSGKYGSMFQILITRQPPVNLPAPADPAGSPWLAGFGLVWLAGFLALSLRRLGGILATRRLLERSRPCRDPRLLKAVESVRILLDGRPVELRVQPGHGAAFVAGLFRPRIVLPAEAAQWPPERLASTLLHEHVHAQRLDVPVAEGLRLVAALAWCSPFPWRALALALRLREQACDAAVLRAGVPRVGYATDLLDAARSLAQVPDPVAAAALAARASHLEGRIRAILAGPGTRPWWDRPLRTAAAAGLVAAALGLARLAGPLYRLPEFSAQEGLPRGPGEWLAGVDARPGPGAGRGAFALVPEDGYVRIRLRFRGNTRAFRVPAVALPGMLPLGGRARMIVPFGDLVDGQSRQPFFNPGWSIWDVRQAPALAAGTGRVVVDRVDPRSGPVIEVAHGDGLRTRYVLGLAGRSLVQAGEHVTAGTPLGIPGARTPLDLPVLHFSILVPVGEERVSLDPAPFLLASASNRRTPLCTSVVNAAVRLEDRVELDRLLAGGVTPDHPATDGTLPLEWALLTRNLPIVRDLLAAGADPRVATWDVHQAHIAWHGPTLTELARDSGDPALVALFATR
jgi:murein DD-endopeptidase MepM/ murein hydrolase activator NlpD